MSEELKCPGCGNGINGHTRQGYFPLRGGRICDKTPQDIAIYHIGQERRNTFMKTMKEVRGCHRFTRKMGGQIAAEIILARIMRLPGAPTKQEFDSEVNDQKTESKESV